MDWGVVMGYVTAVMLVAYLGIVIWAYRGGRRAAFDEASRAPLLDDGDAR